MTVADEHVQAVHARLTPTYAPVDPAIVREIMEATMRLIEEKKDDTMDF